MKLDIECVRDIMLALEKHLDLDSEGWVQPFCTADLSELPELSKYSKPELLYTVRRLEEGGFLHTKPDNCDLSYSWFMGDCGITYKGHEFIGSIRPQPVWLSVGKKVAKASGSVSLKVLVDLAEEALKNFLHESDDS